VSFLHANQKMMVS